jgi:cysteinyl-tRNA synthetase
MLKIFDTLQHKEVELDFQPGQTVNFYSCGPTVYNYSHIGNLRSFIMNDVLVRTLKANGIKVRWVMNITDIEDKIIKSTIAQYGSDATLEKMRTYTQHFTERFLADLRSVGIKTENIEFINATDAIPEIQDFIMKLIEQGIAYKADDGSTYFSIEQYQEKFSDYGALVGEKFLEGKKLGARIKNDEYEKEDLSDFALWKAWDEADGQIFWDHYELGKGRPGWHIECSAINRLAFKEQPIDIHTGGIDLVFPHHTNEIAQSQPLGPFVKHWIHFEHLLVDGKKMSKSLKNFYTLDDIHNKNFSGLDLRYLFLQSKYNQQTNFTWDALEAARNGRMKLVNAKDENSAKEEIDTEFITALNNSFNTAEALSLAHKHKEKISVYDKVLGILSTKFQPKQEIPPEVEKLLTQRQLARDNKDFDLSDQIRDKILDLGFEVKDTPEGQQATKKGV